MADASELEQWQVQSRGISPWLLVIFIVLTVGGLLGCYFLYTKWIEAQKVTDSLKASVSANVEKPLRDAQIKVKVSPSSPEKYGKEFFAIAKQVLDKGTKYDAFKKLVGWSSREELLKRVTSATDLRAVFENLTTANSSLKSQVGTLQKELATARADLKTAKETAESTRRDLQANINRRLAELARLKEAHGKSLSGERRRSDQIEGERGKVRGAVDGLKAEMERVKKAKAAEASKFEAKIVKLKKEIEKLKEFEPELPGPDGRLLTVNLGLRFAVVNIGEKDQVEKGEKFEVFELTRGGAKRVKGQAIVRTVKAKVSHVGILKQTDPGNPIIAGDMIKRVKPRRKYEIGKRAEMRSAKK